MLCQQGGTWAVRPFRQHWEGLTRGYDCRLLGELLYDPAAGRFERFDLLAAETAGAAPSTTPARTIPCRRRWAPPLSSGATPADRTPPHANLRRLLRPPRLGGALNGAGPCGGVGGAQRGLRLSWGAQGGQGRAKLVITGPPNQMSGWSSRNWWLRGSSRLRSKRGPGKTPSPRSSQLASK